MDIVTLALARKYVNKKIKDLGTIQRLAGRVNTLEDLNKIKNPQAGDVYIVGTSDTENAEYMYIGNAWERLGPMLDLSNLVTIEDLINRLSSYATIEYVDNQIDSLNNQTDNKLSNYYTKAEIDAIINNIVGQLQYTPTSQDVSSLSMILGEDVGEIESVPTNNLIDTKLDDIIGDLWRLIDEY